MHQLSDSANHYWVFAQVGNSKTLVSPSKTLRSWISIVRQNHLWKLPPLMGFRREEAWFELLVLPRVTFKTGFGNYLHCHQSRTFSIEGRKEDKTGNGFSYFLWMTKIHSSPCWGAFHVQWSMRWFMLGNTCKTFVRQIANMAMSSFWNVARSTIQPSLTIWYAPFKSEGQILPFLEFAMNSMVNEQAYNLEVCKTNCISSHKWVFAKSKALKNVTFALTWIHAVLIHGLFYQVAFRLHH